MKNNVLFAIALLFIFSTQTLLAQKAAMHINVANTATKECTLIIHNNRLMTNYLKKGYVTLSLDAKGSASYTADIKEPQFISIECDSSSANNTPTFRYSFFISPGDNITFSADFKLADRGFKVTGKGSNNNQPLVTQLAGMDIQKFYGDTTPTRILAALNVEHEKEAAIFKDYIALYKPSAAFIKAYKTQLDYYVPNTYYNFSGNNKYRIEKVYARNYLVWQHISDSLFNVAKLDNEKALSSYTYRDMASSFMWREKERLWNESRVNPDVFYKEWYNADRATGEKLFRDDQSNLLQEKIINKYFTGKAAEYLYAVLFDDAFAESDPKNMIEIYGRFKQRYPHSRYIGWFQPGVDAIIKKQQNTLTSDMVFAAENGSNLKTFDEVLNLVKGKVVLLDMWGTWCGPCRAETEKNGEAIKAYFKSKGLDYLYVANYDLKNEDNWKKLIAYFKMTGLHILANDDLNKDIMSRVKGRGYPTYVIINKDGTFELSKAGYPMDREVLIKQIEAALAK